MPTATKSITLKAPIASNPHYTLTAYFTEEEYSIPNNTSKIRARATLTVDNTSSFSGSNNGTLEIWWYDNNNWTNGKKLGSYNKDSMSTNTSFYVEKTINATHKADGTLSGYAKAVWTKTSNNTAVPVSGNVSTNDTSLTTIPRKSDLTISKGGKGIADIYVLINIDRKATNFTDTLSWTCSNLSETIQTKGTDTKIALFFDETAYSTTTVSGYVKKLSSHTMVELMNLIPNTSSITMTFTDTTYNGNTSIGSTTATFKYEVYKSPYVMNLTAEVIDSLTTTLTGTNTSVIKGISNLQITNTPTKTINDNCTIQSYIYIPDVGNSYEGNLSVYTFEKFKGTQIYCSLKDSRGLSPAIPYIVDVSQTLINYFTPTINEGGLVANRTEATSSTINWSVDGTFWNGNFGATTNALYVNYRFKIDNGSYGNYTQVIPTKTNNTYTYSGTINVPSNSNATLEVKVSDSTNSSYTLTASITKGESLFDIGEDILKINNNTAIDGSFAVGSSGSNEVLLLNGQEIKPYIPVARTVGLNSNTNYTISSTYGHTLVKLDVAIMNLNATNKITYSTTNGYFTIGSGVNHIRVNGNVMMRGIVSALIGEIAKVSGSTTTIISANYGTPTTTGQWVSVGLTPKIIEVSQNDKIELTISCGATGTMTVAGGAGQFTYLNVEVVD